MNHSFFLKSNDISAVSGLISTVQISLLKFEDLVAIKEPKYLKRYNPLTIRLENQSAEALGVILITVNRSGSNVGEDNTCIIPLDTYGLEPGKKGKYKLLAFDPFNERFENIQVRLTTLEDWKNRSVTDNWIARASEFTKKLKWYHLV